jgi:hypothetical protein
VSLTDFTGLFSDGQTQSLTILDLISWRQGKYGSRLLLPPIQRSLVWSNEQIINYWDSLLRGYPAGMMIVHRVKIEGNDANSQGRDADGNTQQANKEDFQLFDGQQRMAAILLGFAEGQLKDSHKIWIDFGVEPSKNSGLKFQLRVSSTGQPFGYKAEAPNQKFELGKRQAKWKEWREKHEDKKTPQQAFSETLGSDLIGATCAIPLGVVCNLLRNKTFAETITTLAQTKDAVATIVNEFVDSLQKALAINVVLQKVGAEIAGNQEEYIRFFGRLGQGGTSLSNDELTYSIIKHHYPKIHDRMRAIIEGTPGRLAGEVDLALAALRVAKAVSTWEASNESEKIGRPSPSFVSKLNDKKMESVHLQFLEMIGQQNQTAILFTALTQIREALSYSDARPTGMPAILLGCLPRELVDVLLLFAVKYHSAPPDKDDGFASLPAFVLYWLLFVHDDGKAAWYSFRLAGRETWCLSKESIRDLIVEFEKEGIARLIPQGDALTNLREEVKRGDHRIRLWAERFTAADHAGESKYGEALRHLSTNRGLAKRALMWLQRQYITGEFSDYDPTSDRDEDLPIDLDHIVPHDIFTFDWRYRYYRLDDNAVKYIDANPDNFRWQRSLVGNSLGNYRWLAASRNRGRGKRAFEPLENNADLVSNEAEWNSIIPQEANNNRRWSLEDIALFQRLIDLRTLELYEKILTESGIEGILPTVSTQQSTDFVLHNGPTKEMHTTDDQSTYIQQ